MASLRKKLQYPGEDATCVEIVTNVFESGLAALKQQMEG